MQYNLLDYKHITNDFITHIESNYTDLLNVKVKTRATLHFLTKKLSLK